MGCKAHAIFEKEKFHLRVYGMMMLGVEVRVLGGVVAYTEDILLLCHVLNERRIQKDLPVVSKFDFLRIQREQYQRYSVLPWYQTFKFVEKNAAVVEAFMDLFFYVEQDQSPEFTCSCCQSSPSVTSKLDEARKHGYRVHKLSSANNTFCCDQCLFTFIQLRECYSALANMQQCSPILCY